MNNAVEIQLQPNGICRVSLNRADKHNAFDDSVIEELNNAFKEVAANSQAKVMVLASTGKSFSAGADLRWMKRMAEYSYQENLADAEALAAMLKSLDRLPIPTIARVQGLTFGGAVGLVSCCDIAVGTSAARFSLSEVKLGLVPATISPYVIAAIGQRAARRFFLTAETIDAETAKQLNLLSEVVAEDQLDATVDQFALALLSNGEHAIRASKKLIFEVAGQTLNDELIAHTSAVIAAARVSVEGQQRLAKFLDSRDK